MDIIPALKFKPVKLSSKTMDDALESLLLEIESIKSGFTLNEIFKTIGKRLQKNKISTAVSIVDDQRQSIFIKHVSLSDEYKLSFPFKKISQIKINELDGYRAVLNNGSAVFCENRISQLKKNLPQIKPFLDNLSETNSIISPLILRSEIVGFLELFSPNLKKDNLPEIEEFSKKLIFRIANAILYDEVKKSEKKYRDLFENAQEGFFILNKRLKKLIAVNKKLCGISGYSQEELLEMDFVRLFAAQERKKINGYLKKKFNNPSGSLKTLLLTKEREHRFVKISIVQIMGEDEFFAIIKDNTELVKAKENLKTEEAKLITMIDSLPDLAWFKDVNSKFIKVNKAFAERIGRSSPNELKGKTSFDIWPPKLAKRYQTEDMEVVKTGKIMKNDDVITRKNGEKIIFETIKGPVYGKDKKIIGSFGVARDITERKQTEEALHESEEKYRKLIDNAHDAVAIINGSGYLIFANQAFYKLTGYNKTDLINFHFAQLIHADDRDIIVKMFNDRVAGKKTPSTYEFKIVTKTGKIKHLSYSGSSLKTNGQTIGIQAIARDITEQKILQEKIINSKKHYEQIIDTIQDSICVIDKNHKITGFNKTFLKKVGLPVNKIKNEQCRRIIPRYEKGLFKDHCTCMNLKACRNKECNVNKVFKSRRVLKFIEKNTDKSGRVFYHKFSIFPTKNKDGQVYQAVLTIRNITQRKIAEEEIRRLNEFNEKILNNAPVSIITMDKKGIITSANNFFYSLAEKTNQVKQSIYGRNFFMRENLVGKYKELLKTGRSFSKLNCRTVNIKGEIKYLNIVAVPLKGKKGEIEGAISMAVDNTEAVLTKQKIEELNRNLEKIVAQRTRQLDEANRELGKVLDLKSKFISDASHELRTPLTVIQGNLDLTMREAEKTSNKRPEALVSMNKEIGQMSRIISDLTMLSNTDSNSERISYEKVNLAHLIRATAQSLKIIAKRKNIKIDYQRGLKDINIMGDESKLEKLMLNLVGNAIKYNEKGGLVKIRSEKDNGRVKISIEDNGLGIPAEDLPFIFERFYRVDKARSRGEGGTGLGLAIAKWIAEAHNGRIEVESKLGEGSRFTIHLPCDYEKQPLSSALL